jgi:hypothetical protein
MRNADYKTTHIMNNAECIEGGLMTEKLQLVELLLGRLNGKK